MENLSWLVRRSDVESQALLRPRQPEYYVRILLRRCLEERGCSTGEEERKRQDRNRPTASPAKRFHVVVEMIRDLKKADRRSTSSN